MEKGVFTKKKCNFGIDVVAVRLVKETSLLSEHAVTTPREAVEVLGEYIRQMDRECVAVINLTASMVPICCSVVSIGALSQSLVSVREVFKASILANAHSIIMMHNHPSGRLNPSKADMDVTYRVSEAGKILGIQLLDHIIVGPSAGYYSFRDNRLITMHDEMDVYVAQNGGV